MVEPFDNLTGLDDLVDKDGNLKDAPKRKPRAGRRTRTGIPIGDVSVDDDIQRMLTGEQKQQPAEAIAHDGKSDAGHTPADKPTTTTDESW